VHGATKTCRGPRRCRMRPRRRAFSSTRLGKAPAGLPSSPHTAPWTTLYPFGEKTQGQQQVHQGHAVSYRGCLTGFKTRTPNVADFAQFLAVCSASTLTEELRISSPFSSQSRANREVALRHTGICIYQFQLSTKSDTLSGLHRPWQHSGNLRHPQPSQSE
jgi:hypothetical protein